MTFSPHFARVISSRDRFRQLRQSVELIGCIEHSADQVGEAGDLGGALNLALNSALGFADLLCCVLGEAPDQIARMAI
jgi:hypothetical protein